jgi:hypothetical protein
MKQISSQVKKKSIIFGTVFNPLSTDIITEAQFLCLNSCTAFPRHFEVFSDIVLIFWLVINRWQHYALQCSSFDQTLYFYLSIYVREDL